MNNSEFIISTPGTAGARGATGPTGPSVTGPTGPAAVPASPNTSVQFNDAGAFGGNAAFEFDKTTGIMTVTTFKGIWQGNTNAIVYDDTGVEIGRFFQTGGIGKLQLKRTGSNSQFSMYEPSGGAILAFSSDVTAFRIMGRFPDTSGAYGYCFTNGDAFGTAVAGFFLLDSNTVVLATNFDTSAKRTLLQAGSRLATVSKTADYAATVLDHTIRVDASGGNRIITLPQANTCEGLVLNIKKIDSSGNTVTIDGTSTETIDGSLTKVISTQFSVLTVQCNGVSWDVI